MRLQAFRSLYGKFHVNATATALTATSSLLPRGARKFATALSNEFLDGNGDTNSAKERDAVRITKVVDLIDDRAVLVTFEDGATAKFHNIWLRDHCRCEHCMHPETQQRQLDTASIPLNMPLQRLDVTDAGNMVVIDWDAPVRGTMCKRSKYHAKWLREHAYAFEGGTAEDKATAPYPKLYRQPRLTTKKLWAGADFKLPTYDFAKCVSNIEPLMRDLYMYGLVQVVGTPSSMEATEQFATKIGFVLRTIYGTMWTTNPHNDAEGYNDTAATNLELLHHTDGTYMSTPPGLQIFNCVDQAGKGGESRYVDAFHVVQTLKNEHREAFQFLSETSLPYFTVDNDAHLATMEPLIGLDYAGNITQFRHNDYDRAPLTHLNCDQVFKFYEAHRNLLEIIRRPEMEFCTKLKVGQMMVIDNQRVMHGRNAFHGKDRALVGCYIGRTEYESRLRVLGII